MSSRAKARVRNALTSRDDEINAAFERLYAPFDQSDSSTVPSGSKLASAARALRDNYSDVSDAVAKAGAHVSGAGTLAEGLADYSAAYDKLASGLHTTSQKSGNSALDDMEELLDSAEKKVSGALRRLRL
jgi:hypothetical protein